MPIGVLSRIPASVSRDGTCKTNLRGVTPSAPYDYAVPSRTFTVGEDLASISTAGAGAWSSAIPRAYQNTDSEGQCFIDYPSLLSTATSGTLLFRIYIQPFGDPGLTPGTQTVFRNGSSGTDGYAVYLTYDLGESESEYNLFFARMQDASAAWIQLNSSPLTEETWYQYSVRFEQLGALGGGGALPAPFLGEEGGGEEGAPEEGAPEEGGGGFSFLTNVVSYENGSFVINSDIQNAIDTPSEGGTRVFEFFGRMTDFVFLESTLSNEQLAAFGTAPYI